MKEKQLFNTILEIVNKKGGIINSGIGELFTRKIAGVTALIYKDRYHIKTIGAINSLTNEYFFPLENVMESLKNCHIAVSCNQIINSMILK